MKLQTETYSKIKEKTGCPSRSLHTLVKTHNLAHMIDTCSGHTDGQFKHISQNT